LLLLVVVLVVFMLLVVVEQVVLYPTFLDSCQTHRQHLLSDQDLQIFCQWLLVLAVLRLSIQVQALMVVQVLTLPSLAQDHGV
jgi:hypothetical protein